MDAVLLSHLLGFILSQVFLKLKLLELGALPCQVHVLFFLLFELLHQLLVLLIHDSRLDFALVHLILERLGLLEDLVSLRLPDASFSVEDLVLTLDYLDPLSGLFISLSLSGL